MARPITRVRLDMDSGHAPGYAPSNAYSVAQVQQDKEKTGNSSERPHGPYAGSGNVRVGKKGAGIHRQFDIRLPHIPIPPNVVVESPAVLEGGSFPWLKTASSTVYVNTQGCGRQGDITVCGAIIMTGELAVLAGD